MSDYCCLDVFIHLCYLVWRQLGDESLPQLLLQARLYISMQGSSSTGGQVSHVLMFPYLYGLRPDVSGHGYAASVEGPHAWQYCLQAWNALRHVLASIRQGSSQDMPPDVHSCRSNIIQCWRQRCGQSSFFIANIS